MSNCLCLACDRANSITTKFCTQCGAKLQIQERYRALKVIGQGGFGKTFLAQDESKPSQPRCVIKQFAFETINPNASQGTLDVAIRLFEQEAKRLDDLGKHPQIPELLSFTIHEGKQYLIQEFIDGETLEQELARVGAFSEQQVRDVLVEVLQILEFVHSKSVIHRDISPDNIIRRRGDQKLVLVDFGAAKHATATLLAKTGTGIGKPSYGAPEQMLGKSVFQSDLFGLGVTCLHLLTNVEPFTLYDVLENEYQWRQFLNGKVVSDEFGKLLDQMTAYRVKERPESIRGILQYLGIDQQSLNSVNNSDINSFKRESLSQYLVSIPSVVTNKQTIKTASSNNSISNQNVAKHPVELISAKGIDYQELEKFLKAKKWCEADELTTKLMPKLKSRRSRYINNSQSLFTRSYTNPRLDYKTYYSSDYIQEFPCEDLRTIDQLWIHYSDGKFGFSVQKKIWLDCGGDIGNFRNLVDFGIKVGWYYPNKFFSRKKNRWKTYDEFMTDTKNAQNTLVGSLPLASFGWWYHLEHMHQSWWGGWELFQRKDL
jgi:serine/threonine protein kinase